MAEILPFIEHDDVAAFAAILEQVFRIGLSSAERDDVLSGTPPTLYPVGSGEFARLEIGPGLVWMLGGAPGAGKTAFIMQLVIDALRLSPLLRVLVGNVEMSAGVLLGR